MRKIEFRYNRHKSTFSLLLLIFILAGLLMLGAGWVENHVLKMIDVYGNIPPYWKQHREMGLAILFLLPVFCIILPLWPALRLWRVLMDAHGYIELYDTYAILHYGKKELLINKENTRLDNDPFNFGRFRMGNVFFPPMKVYILYQGKKKYYLLESVQEGFEKTTAKERWIGVRLMLSFH